MKERKTTLFCTLQKKKLHQQHGLQLISNSVGTQHEAMQDGGEYEVSVRRRKKRRSQVAPHSKKKNDEVPERRREEKFCSHSNGFWWPCRTLVHFINSSFSCTPTSGAFKRWKLAILLTPHGVPFNFLSISLSFEDCLHLRCSVKSLL